MRTLSFKTIGTLITVLLSISVIWMTGRALLRLDERSRESGLYVTREAVSRTVMQCYALEGVYPPDIEYLRERYGLVIDEARYYVYYEVVAGNIHPVIDIRLLEDMRYDT